MLPDSGFTRQASEPAKPFNRQVSEQTTAGSGVTLEEGSTEPEGDSYRSQLASYLSAAHTHARPLLENNGGSGPAPVGGAFANSFSADLASAAALQAVFHAASNAGMTAPTQMSSPVPATGLLPIPRFCPNCGAEAEPNHRFCPYCCFQLQMFPGIGALPTGSPSAPSLLASLRRFRYVEACPADVDMARALCFNFMHGRKA